MKYKLYTRSEKAWSAMLEAIRGAQKSIYLESFILTDDQTTASFFETLKEKARAGVRVKLIIDRVNHYWYGSVNKSEFEKAGAEVVFFNRWLYRSHRKVLVIDEAIAFLGGVNIRGEYAQWLDLHIRLTGHLVKHILSSFSRVYELAGGLDPSVLELRKKGAAFQARHTLYKSKSWFMEHWPFRGQSVLKQYYKRKCAEAQKKITIVTPYFMPHQWLLKSLRSAANRGVNIELIIPQATDIWIIDQAHRVFANNWHSFIKAFFLPEMNHAKVLLVDDREGLIGSNNIDAQSFDFNLETSVVFQRKDMVGDLKKIIEQWRSRAVSWDNLGWRAKWYHKILGFFIKFLQPIL